MFANVEPHFRGKKKKTSRRPPVPFGGALGPKTIPYSKVLVLLLGFFSGGAFGSETAITTRISWV